jgi:hypothetical protein
VTVLEATALEVTVLEATAIEVTALEPTELEVTALKAIAVEATTQRLIQQHPTGKLISTWAQVETNDIIWSQTFLCDQVGDNFIPNIAWQLEV